VFQEMNMNMSYGRRSWWSVAQAVASLWGEEI